MRAPLASRLETLCAGSLPPLPDALPTGDMPGDQIRIGEEHRRQAALLFPRLADKLRDAAASRDKLTVSVYGGSGAGKSEIASLLAGYLRGGGIGCYVLSGDNYPHRIPMYNDAERVRIYSTAGMKGLLAEGLYGESVQKELDALWPADGDADPAQDAGHPWLSVYRKYGRDALRGYLGTELEQDYDQLCGILEAFHRGNSPIWLKRMGRTEEARWYSPADFRETEVLLVEWTHGGNPALKGVDVSVFLYCTPEETREHRRNRARDGKTDSPFTAMVLEIEQEELLRAAPGADLILSKAGEFLRPEAFGGGVST